MIHNVDQALVKQKRAHAAHSVPHAPDACGCSRFCGAKTPKPSSGTPPNGPAILLVVVILPCTCSTFSLLKKCAGVPTSSMTFIFKHGIEWFVVVAMSRRFVFSISLEGKAFLVDPILTASSIRITLVFQVACSGGALYCRGEPAGGVNQLADSPGL